MALSLGGKLGIRSMVYVAGKPLPFFWPMRSFIHHNPLHGLENQPFSQAVIKAQKLFHARTYLPRWEYRRYLDEGKVCKDTLHDLIHELAQETEADIGIDLTQWFSNLLLRKDVPITAQKVLFGGELLQAGPQQFVLGRIGRQIALEDDPRG